MVTGLQFRGTEDLPLLVVLLGAIGAVLVGWGVWSWLRGRRDDAWICLSAALGPLVAGAVLLGMGLRRRLGGQEAGALLASGGLLLAASAAVGMMAGSPGAFWMSLLGVQVVLAVGAFYRQAYQHLGPVRVAGLLALRSGAVLAVLALLFQPVYIVALAPGEAKPYLVIAVDRSASMGISDEPGMPSRYRQSIDALHAQQRRIDDQFRPAWMHFATAARRADSLGELASLQPSGEGTEGTNIAAALRAAAGDFHPADLAGIVLVTDGGHNAPDILLPDAVVAAGAPVHVVGVGATSARASAGATNLSIAAIDAPMVAPANNVTQIEAHVRAVGFAGRNVSVRLIDADGFAGEPVELWPQEDDEQLVARLSWTPRLDAPGAVDGTGGAQGVRRLRVQIEPRPGEVTDRDNHADVHVLVTQARLRVLYVEGTIRPEYKYLRRALDSDADLRLISLVRVSGSEFSSLGTIDGREMPRLPVTAEDFALFDVILLGDLDSTFLTPEQMERLAEFVQGGGGLVMLGGHNSFGPGGYGGTPLEDVLPVLTGSRRMPQETMPFLPGLTAAGEAHPILAGLGDLFPGPEGRPPHPAAPQLAELRGCVSVERAKPAATVLAVHPARRNEHGPLIVLAVQRVGGGRVAAWTADTTWQWYLPMRPLGADSPYQRFWSQLVRWLGGVDDPGGQGAAAVVLRLPVSHTRAGSSVRVLAQVQHPDDAQLGRETVSLRATLDGARDAAQTLPLRPTQTRGLYEGEFRADRPGRWTLAAEAMDATGGVVAGDELGLTVAPFSREAEQTAQDVALLRQIAERSGGTWSQLAGLPELVDHIGRARLSRFRGPTTASYSLYSFPLLFLLFVGLMSAEWILRRRWQLQ